MFLQAPHRESVIFFSTGKKLIRAPRVEKPEGLALQHRHGPVSSEQRRFVPVQDDVSAESEPSCQINPSVQRLHRGNADLQPSPSPQTYSSSSD